MRRLSVVDSRHVVLVRVKVHQKSLKIHRNALSNTLIMSGFKRMISKRIFTFSRLMPQFKTGLRAFFLEQTQLREVLNYLICLLERLITAGTATFLVKA